MAQEGATSKDSTFRLLAITQGSWGERIADNIAAHAPPSWLVKAWAAPRVLPPIIDDPEDFLPTSLPPSDLILALGDTAGVAQLIPEVVHLTGAQAVIAPIDNNASLPSGLARQLAGWLADMQVQAVFPRPFCSLTETTYNRKPLLQSYDSPLIREFARHFGCPAFHVQVQAGQVTGVEVLRDSACGCARHVAQGLPGTPVADAPEAAGMLHHHYPCLASMEKDPDYQDTLMHVSGNLLKDALKAALEPHLPPVPYLRPSGLSDPTEES